MSSHSYIYIDICGLFMSSLLCEAQNKMCKVVVLLFDKQKRKLNKQENKPRSRKAYIKVK